MNNWPQTPCCNKTTDASNPYPVYWNPYNQVMQCHFCGHTYVPQKLSLKVKIHNWAIGVYNRNFSSHHPKREVIRMSCHTGK